MNSQDFRNLQEAYLEVVSNQLDEAEGSYGQTPKAHAAYIALATAKGKSSKTKSLALKHAIRSAADRYNSDSGKPYSYRSMMTQSDRDYHRGQSENHGEDREGIDYDEFDTGASGPGGKPKGKKLERQIKRGVSAESFDLYDIILSHLLDEGAAENVANRAQKLANQKGRTPEERDMFQDLANKARERDEAQNPNPMRSVGSSRFEYNQKHGRPLITPEVSQSRSSQGTLGGVTYQRGPNRLPKSQRKYDRQVLSGVRAASEQEKQRARERMGIKEDIYDIILSHLLDEGYADTQEQAEVIMVNMSEDWRESICEGYKRFPYGRVEYQIQKKEEDEEDNPTGRGTPQSIKMSTVVRHFRGGKEIPPVEKREYSPQISKAREAENRARGAENRARRTQEG